MKPDTKKRSPKCKTCAKLQIALADAATCVQFLAGRDNSGDPVPTNAIAAWRKLVKDNT